MRWQHYLSVDYDHFFSDEFFSLNGRRRILDTTKESLVASSWKRN